LIGSTLSDDNCHTSYVLVLLMTIIVVVVVIIWGCPCPPFILKGVGVKRKVPYLVTIVILIELYLYSFLITRFKIIRVGLYLCELCCYHLVVISVYAEPPHGPVSLLNHIHWVRTLDNILIAFKMSNVL
jgi:hypothetical protein